MRRDSIAKIPFVTFDLSFSVMESNEGITELYQLAEKFTEIGFQVQAEQVQGLIKEFERENHDSDL